VRAQLCTGQHHSEAHALRSGTVCKSEATDTEAIAAMCRLLEPKLQRSIATSVARGMAHLHSRSPPILHLVGLDMPGHTVLLPYVCQVSHCPKD
jgi:hypothetical protein